MPGLCKGLWENVCKKKIIKSLYKNNNKNNNNLIHDDLSFHVGKWVIKECFFFLNHRHQYSLWWRSACLAPPSLLLPRRILSSSPPPPPHAGCVVFQEGGRVQSVSSSVFCFFYSPALSRSSRASWLLNDHHATTTAVITRLVSARQLHQQLHQQQQLHSTESSSGKTATTCRRVSPHMTVTKVSSLQRKVVQPGCWCCSLWVCAAAGWSDRASESRRALWQALHHQLHQHQLHQQLHQLHGVAPGCSSAMRPAKHNSTPGCKFVFVCVCVLADRCVAACWLKCMCF